MKVSRRSFSKLAPAATFGAGAGLSFFARAAAQAAAQPDNANQPLFLKSQDLKWQQMFPDLGEASPEITILRVDPATQATHLMIRNPKKMHVPRHWHSASETHTVLAGSMVFECAGKQETLGPGGFNYIPNNMVHQAWLPDNGWVLITVDAAWDTNWVDGPPGPEVIGKTPAE
ncbi:MAG: cupin domain-containing protein [Acidobacteria bacterium]|nr:cupin domain-containing protein [Acidobacteriota bacterium]